MNWQLLLLIPWCVLLVMLVIGGVLWALDRGRRECHRCHRTIAPQDGLLCEDCTGHLERRSRSRRNSPPAPHHFPIQD